MNQGIIVHFHRITLHLHFLPVAPGGRWHYYYIFCYISYIIGLEAGFIGWVYSRFPASDESMEWVCHAYSCLQIISISFLGPRSPRLGLLARSLTAVPRSHG